MHASCIILNTIDRNEEQSSHNDNFMFYNTSALCALPRGLLLLLFVKDLIGLVGCFRYIIVNYTIKCLNTIGNLGIIHRQSMDILRTRHRQYAVRCVAIRRNLQQNSSQFVGCAKLLVTVL